MADADQGVHDAFDKIFNDAWDAQADEPSSTSKDADIDAVIEGAFSKHEAQDDELSDFEGTRETREALRGELESLSMTGANIGTVLLEFLELDQRMQKDPIATADLVASRYLSYSPYDKPRAAQEKKSEFKADIDKVLESSFDKLDARERDQDDWKDTEKARQALKEKYPNLSFKEAATRVLQIHRDLRADPLGGAARLAATYGAPVTASQHAVVQTTAANQQLLKYANDTIIGPASRSWPQFDKLMDRTTEILSNAAFKSSASRDPTERLWQAYQQAMGEAASGFNADRVAKAKAAMSPASSGTAPQVKSGGDSLDSILSTAFAGWPR